MGKDPEAFVRIIIIGESQQPWAIFQFSFFFWQVDNKKNQETNIVASQYISLDLL